METKSTTKSSSKRGRNGAGSNGWKARYEQRAYMIALIVLIGMGISTAYAHSGMSRGTADGMMKQVSRTSVGIVEAIRSRADWESEQIPAFCQDIKEYPQPHRKNCSTRFMDEGTPKCDESRAMMFSQYGEDYYLYTRHFSKLKRAGIYVDIATNDPIGISNTYFMDRCLAWSGICVEANPKYYERIHRERSCALVPTCVSEKDGEQVEFAMSGPGSGIVSTHRQGRSIEKRALSIVRKRCVSMDKQLRRYNVSHIDYLNVDVEGHELEVLRSFNWPRISVNIISVEVTATSRILIRQFLESKGFDRLYTEDDTANMKGMPIYDSNEFYVHSSVIFGKPL